MRYLWYSMYGFAAALALYSLFFRPAATVESPPVDPTPMVAQEAKVEVQIALLLDTSSSMDGLVAQARAQMWEMVSEMQVDGQGRERKVAIALYQYGNNRLSYDSGFLQQVAPLTTNFDLVAAELESLSTSGGQEYAPLAIHRALQELQWDSDDGVERIVVVAGNENFSQGPLTVESVMQQAKDKNIRVIPIYCANRGTTRGALESWKRASALAGIDFQSIDPDQAVVEIESPYDRQILEKYRALEQTRGGTTAVASASSPTSVERAVVYSRQDSASDSLQEYERTGLVPSRSLPQAVQGRSREAQELYLRQQIATRNQLKRELQQLSDLRQEHVRKQSVQQAKPASLGSAFRATVR